MSDNARFVLSRSKAISKYNELKKISDVVSYSYKTNPDIGKLLEKETDCMFSVHSSMSLKQLSSPRRAWFFAQSWSEQKLNELFDTGCNKFVVDNVSDLTKLLDYLKKHGKKIQLLLRMKLKEYTVQTGKHFVFGMYSSQINDLIPKLKKNEKITKLGIHFHRKTQNVSEWSLKEELEESIDEKNLTMIDYVNIGGGIPAQYKNFRPYILKNIFEKIKDLKHWLNKKNIKVIIEPGRYIAAYPIKLEAEIINIYNNNIVINCSVYNAAMDTFVAHIRLLVENEKESGTRYTIKGCTPDSMDIFRYSVYLNNPKIGDKLVFLNAGAYNYTTDFCNLPKLETIIVD